MSMKPIKIKRRNKYKMYLAMKKSEELAPYLPHTRRWVGKKRLYQMLDEHGDIVIKPNRGLKGKNIYFVSKQDGSYVVQIFDEQFLFIKKHKLYRFLRERIGKVSYIIQKRIHTAVVNGNPFDMRVIIQRNSINDPWKVTAYKLRVAGDGKLITNANTGGSVVSFKEAMSNCNIPLNKQKGLLEKIKQVSLLSAEVLGPSYNYQLIFGTDVGVMRDGSIHVFEINRGPAKRGFTPDHMKTIKEYIRAGRKAKKKFKSNTRTSN
ncbi:YheC/YheD family protein [Bacillus sp. H-16]|uniref:YheC/YheD family protein n=1 Tax=Alteribacter salitolerans TaxID=2912333 RepID=UPI0019641F80|nr:YheC/YheD family protein [Alteribacter salitolerans]MBM7095010.1 YheC/YheD family protein [Alteribacter salitolerans]